MCRVTVEGGVESPFLVVELDREDRAVEAVDMVFVSLRLVWSGGMIESMNSVGESVEVGVAWVERRCSETEPRDDCGVVVAAVGESVLLMMILGLLVLAERVVC